MKYHLILSLIRKTATAATLYLFSTSITAETLDKKRIDNTYIQAELAFENKNYVDALTHYKVITTSFANISNDMLQDVRYNIAVCHYKLGHWEKSEEILLALLASSPGDSLIELNLALTEYKLGKLNSAQKRLNWIYQTAESDDIAFLALDKLDEIEKNYPTKSIADNANSRGSSRWRFNGSLGYGSDDNVVSYIDDIETTQSDTYREVNLNPSWQSTSDFNNSWIIDGLYFQSQYSENNDYDIDVSSIGIRKFHELNGTHRISASLRFNNSAVGGKGYLNSNSLSFQGRYKKETGLHIRYGLRYQQSSEQRELYKPYAGSSIRYHAGVHQYLGAHRFGFLVQLDTEDKNDSIGDSSSFEDTRIYSVTRNTLTVDYNFSTVTWNFRAFLSSRNSDYADENIYFNDDGSLIERIQRQDERQTIGVQLSKDINQHLFIDVEIRQSSNDSNIDNYAYDQKLISASLGVMF